MLCSSVLLPPVLPVYLQHYIWYHLGYHKTPTARANELYPLLLRRGLFLCNGRWVGIQIIATVQYIWECLLLSVLLRLWLLQLWSIWERISVWLRVRYDIHSGIPGMQPGFSHFDFHFSNRGPLWWILQTQKYLHNARDTSSQTSYASWQRI